MLVLDEADRMIDLGFEEEIRNTLDHYRGGVRNKQGGLNKRTTKGGAKRSEDEIQQASRI